MRRRRDEPAPNPAAEREAERLRRARYYARAYLVGPGEAGEFDAMNGEELTAFAVERLPDAGAKGMLRALGRDELADLRDPP